MGGKALKKYNIITERKSTKEFWEINENNEKIKMISEKFNGNIIMSWFPNLKGKELGKMINIFKLKLNDNYDNFILNNDINTIFNYFIRIYNEEKE